ncbi:MAG: AAA family ATPase [Candidatus Aenigmarchaeota archaeon]|nr:AAA family ATPase [Candidatus Aenigmarchaeota archaeon]
MARIIAVASGKGGVGKTTTSVNLSTILAEMGFRVAVVDGNLTTPNLGIHFGIPLYPVTIHDVVKGNADIYDAVYVNNNGLKIVPGSISVDDLLTAPYGLGSALESLVKTNDIIILDCAAGLGNEAKESLKIADELILITQPDFPSVTDALRTKKVADGFGVKTTGIVINRHGSAGNLTDEDIEDLLDAKVVSVIPEDRHLQDSIACKRPLVNHKPTSPASKAFLALASHVSGEEIVHEEEGFLDRLFSFFGLK